MEGTMTTTHPRRRVLRGIVAAICGLAVMVSLSACWPFPSTVNTDPNMTALHYESGVATAAKFKDCVPASTFRSDGSSDIHFLYPAQGSARDFKAQDGGETGPITVVSRDNATMKIPVVVNFFLKSSDCNTLKSFHEALGLRYHAYFDGDEQQKVPQGWIDTLKLTMGGPLDIVLDRASQNYNMRQLWNDPPTKVALEKAVNDNLPDLIKQRSGGGDYFEITSIQIGKPEPTDPNLLANINAEQSSVAKAKSAEAEAIAQEAAARAQVAVARARAAGEKALIDVLGPAGYQAAKEREIKADAIAKGINPYPSPIVAGVR
jgi:hypothetical protein